MTNLREKLRDIIDDMSIIDSDGITNDEALSAILQAFKEVVPGEKDVLTDCKCGEYDEHCYCDTQLTGWEGHNDCRQEILERLEKL